uniref:Uncharacterized protein n=1 Tax=Hubei diptera virus 21 TaxID=1922882 RepID=A0A1L3KP72_9VIRU|nr:hypothetical protein 5 [Hubei diptera virus 21]
MSDFGSYGYSIERNFNDFGSRLQTLGVVGKTEVTILDNLYRISQTLMGRILTSANILGGFRVYIPKVQILDVISAYQSISAYKLSSDLDPLIYTLRAAAASVPRELEVPLDNRLILQMIAVHNSISINLGKVWETAVSLRLLSSSGANKDITIDGKQQILDEMLGKFSEGELSVLTPDFERATQLAGIKCPRQVEMRDMIADMLFSRKDSAPTLHELFHSMVKQRDVLREFRTDILFCSPDRFRELDRGLMVNILPHISKSDLGDNEESTTITPKNFSSCEFHVNNISDEAIEIGVAGCIGSGSITLEPLQDITVTGTGITFLTRVRPSLRIQLTSDIRSYSNAGFSIAKHAMDGTLRGNSELVNLFFQIVQPVTHYFPSLLDKLKGEGVLGITLSKFPVWIKNLVNGMQPGSICMGWLLTDSNSEKERIWYIYVLVMILPGFLLDPSFTFNSNSGNPPYLRDYGTFVNSMKKLYE